MSVPPEFVFDERAGLNQCEQSHYLDDKNEQRIQPIHIKSNSEGRHPSTHEVVNDWFFEPYNKYRGECANQRE
jgi:hypothetical protein